MNGSKSKGDGELDVSNLPRAQNYIFGQFEDTDTYIDSYEPSTGKVWALIPNSNGKTLCIYAYGILMLFEGNTSNMNESFKFLFHR